MFIINLKTQFQKLASIVGKRFLCSPVLDQYISMYKTQYAKSQFSKMHSKSENSLSSISLINGNVLEISYAMEYAQIQLNK